MPASPLSVTASTTSSTLSPEAQAVRDLIANKWTGSTQWPTHLGSPTIKAVDSDTWTLFTRVTLETTPPKAFSYTVNRTPSGQFWLQTEKTLFKDNAGIWKFEDKREFAENGDLIETEHRGYEADGKLAQKVVSSYTNNKLTKEATTFYDDATGKVKSSVTKRYDLSGHLTSETRTQFYQNTPITKITTTDYFNGQGLITKRVTHRYRSDGTKQSSTIVEYDASHPEHSHTSHVLKKVSLTGYHADTKARASSTVTEYSPDIQQDSSGRYQAATVRYLNYYDTSGVRTSWFKTTFRSDGYPKGTLLRDGSLRGTYGYYYDNTGQKTGSYSEIISADGKQRLGLKTRQYHPGTTKTRVLDYDNYQDRINYVYEYDLQGQLIHKSENGIQGPQDIARVIAVLERT